MKATVIKEVSLLMKVGSVLIKKDDNFILKGHKEPKTVEVEFEGEKYNPPNFYSKETVEVNDEYFKISG